MLTLCTDLDLMLHHHLLSIHEIWNGKTRSPYQGSENMGHSELLLPACLESM